MGANESRRLYSPHGGKDHLSSPKSVSSRTGTASLPRGEKSYILQLKATVDAEMESQEKRWKMPSSW